MLLINQLILNVCLLLILPVQNINAEDTLKHHSFPFKYVNNKVLVPVNIENSRTFDLILKIFQNLSKKRYEKIISHTLHFFPVCIFHQCTGRNVAFKSN